MRALMICARRANGRGRTGEIEETARGSAAGTNRHQPSAAAAVKRRIPGESHALSASGYWKSWLAAVHSVATAP